MFSLKCTLFHSTFFHNKLLLIVNGQWCLCLFKFQSCIFFWNMVEIWVRAVNINLKQKSFFLIKFDLFTNSLYWGCWLFYFTKFKDNFCSCFWWRVVEIWERARPFYTRVFTDLLGSYQYLLTSQIKMVQSLFFSLLRDPVEICESAQLLSGTVFLLFVNYQ